MKTLFSISFLALMLSTAFVQILPAQHPTGKVIESLQINSKLLKQDVKYSIYLPPDYETSQRLYPVVYLLHGYTDNETAWIQFGTVQHSVDKGIAEGSIAPMIIVMPDAGVTFYVNEASGKFDYEDMFFKEFIPSIEGQYRIRAKKEFRGICGLSMGGYGTMLYALKHPDMFAAAAPLSAAFFDEEHINNMTENQYNAMMKKLYGQDKEGERISRHFMENNVLHLARTLPEESLKSVRYYIDCGDEDFLYKGNAMMWTTLMDRKIPHEFRVRNGAHTWSYWRDGVVDALQFIGQSFHR
ncbi:MAG: esterase family protein [Cyclobacteriaceae bacterium]|nr:esterase family protein [Cyclobacteriaceae bacterium]